MRHCEARPYSKRRPPSYLRTNRPVVPHAVQPDGCHAVCCTHSRWAVPQVELTPDDEEFQMVVRLVEGTRVTHDGIGCRMPPVVKVRGSGHQQCIVCVGGV